MKFAVWETPDFRRLALSETKPNNRMQNQRWLPRADFGAGDSSECWASPSAQRQPTLFPAFVGWR